MITVNVYLARTGERRKVTARDWRSALKATGRADACVVEKRTDLIGNRGSAFDVTFGPDAPTTITGRYTQGSDDAALRWLFDHVAHQLNREAAGQRRTA